MNIIVTGGSGFIGTNLIQYLSSHFPDSRILNLDILPPRNLAQSSSFLYCDINNHSDVSRIFQDFQPDYIFHLAAATGIGDIPLENFSTNYNGVSSVVAALKYCKSLKRIIFASSLLVCKVGYIPQSTSEYCPTTNYGISKMKGELVVKESANSFPWSIVRPISIWGPWNHEPYYQFFDTVLKGRYFHFGSARSLRSLGYVGNTVYQLVKIAFSSDELVNYKTYYLADYEPASLRYMATKIARYRNGSSFIPVIPIWLVRLVARFGDSYAAITKQKFPLTTFRLNNILTEYVFNLSSLSEVCGELPFDLSQGIDATVRWLKTPQSEPPR